MSQTLYFLCTMSISEYRAFRKALAVLVRAGITVEQAADILVGARIERLRK